MTQASSPSETSASVPEPAHDGRKPNRLAQETSPYLLQHADNPVNWYPWGDEAFAAARAADKPIFLSIGYSTCYWCHVMERESFEDEATAAYLNEHFIAIKVDREERPDVDDIYMMATQMMTGRGGWPMSVFLDPATLKPFLAGTYFPATPSHGMSSFRQVLEGVTQAWDQSRDKIITQSDAVADAVTQRLESQTQPQLLSGAQVDAAVRGLMRSYDANNGGFGRSPKFPQPVFLELLLGAAQDDSTAQAAVMNTLTHMAMGGMYDQLGGGFHRYSTDGQWIVPHFEKMLYDNGQLLSVYAEAYARTKNPLYAKVIRETVAYVLREMHDPAGGFFSAQDAEVDAREGLSYLWTRPEVEKALTDAGLAGDVDFALSMFGLSRGANFTDPHFPEDGPKNVLVLTDEHVDQFSERLQHVQHAMLDVRNARKQPRLDDKVLTGWNGLMIAGLADAGRGVGEQAWIDASAAATNFVLSTMRGPDGGLLRAYRGGTARVNAFLEDYALLIHGLLALHQATDDSVWLERAATLAQETDTRFFDTQHGGYFETLANQSDLFVRSKSFYDGAMPSGNGMMAVDLVELYKRTGRSEFLQRASDVLRAASQQLAVGSSTCSLSALALHELLTQTGTDEGADATVATNAPKDSGVVSIKAINVARDGDGERFDLVFTIADGYHINAHDPGDSSLIGLMIDPAGTAGTSSRIEVDYPTGEAMSDHDPLGQRVKVHRESVTIPVHVNVAGPIMLDVRFQACSDVACLAPQTIQFEVRPPPTD